MPSRMIVLCVTLATLSGARAQVSPRAAKLPCLIRSSAFGDPAHARVPICLHCAVPHSDSA
eukprot:14764595-Alexandrium_andersonii.AAC.1